MDRWTPDRRQQVWRQQRKTMGVLSPHRGTSPSGKKKFCNQQPRAEVNPKGTVRWKKLKIWGQETGEGWNAGALLFLSAICAGQIHSCFQSVLLPSIQVQSVVSLPLQGLLKLPVGVSRVLRKSFGSLKIKTMWLYWVQKPLTHGFKCELCSWWENMTQAFLLGCHARYDSDASC